MSIRIDRESAAILALTGIYTMHDLSPSYLNLRFNPFGSLTAEERGELAVIAFDLDPLVRRLKRPGFAVLFLGHSGRGKSTHLFALRSHFPQAPYIYVADGEPTPPFPDAPLLFIDEMQRVPRRRRRELLTQQASFVIGSHRNHRRELEKAGLAYEVVKLKRVSVERAQIIFRKRIEFARRSPDRPLPSVSRKTIRRLLIKHRGDLWAVEDDLYDQMQALEVPAEL